MWKPGQLITIGGSVYRVVREARICFGCDLHNNGCDSSTIIRFKKYSVMCGKRLPRGFALKRISVKYVDLDLPSGTLWADSNIGAKTIESYGDYISFDDAQRYTLPTAEQFKELIRECKWRRNERGCWIIGKNGNAIFLPAAGYRDGSSLSYVGSNGRYWSSSYNNNYPAYYVYFSSGNLDPQTYNYRCYGYSVRLVRNAQ